jgi:DNA-binding MarR family transcriptional regulator
MVGEHRGGVQVGTGRPIVSSQPQVSGGRSPVIVELSKAQVDSVVGMASTGGVVPFLLSRLPVVRRVLESDPLLAEDRRFSGSVLAGLLLLACFPADGAWLSMTEAAGLAGASMSTAHRYIATLVEAGLLERDSRTRQYRLVHRGWNGSRPAGRAKPSIGFDDAASSGEDWARVELSPEHVDQVLQIAAAKGPISAVLSGLMTVASVPVAALGQLENPRSSRSLLTGLLILAVLPVDGSLVRNADVARQLGMSQSTTHRYLGTLLVVGLVEHDEATSHFGLAL